MDDWKLERSKVFQDVGLHFRTEASKSGPILVNPGLVKIDFEINSLREWVTCDCCSVCVPQLLILYLPMTLDLSVYIG